MALFLWNMSFAQNSVAASYSSYGEKISHEKTMEPLRAQTKFDLLKIGDTIDLKFSTKVKSVCKMKGCWMVLELPGDEVRVTFKDYGFFVPKDIQNKEVIVAGKAYLEEISVEDQKHYARDEGKTPEEIDLIKKPALTRSFVAHGVLLKE
ncbi:MAG TPA: DUF4920 domain-containing protein [Salegentibacter sp.]|uniref:DUF4920 domain-containing protein n=1 Tax=Salegentibacter sp. TaxID=1903072 RepID=UPI002F93B207